MFDFLKKKNIDDRYITSGNYQGKDASIIHLEHIKKNQEYKILIDGKHYVLTRSDKNHIWLIKTEINIIGEK